MFLRNNIGEILKKQAYQLGACEKGLDNLEKLNHQELINRFIHFIDFIVDKKDFPSNDFIKKNFDRALLEHNNVFVDSVIEKRNARQVVVIQGKSTGNLFFDGYVTSDLYIRHDSEVTIDCSRMSKIFISVYDNAKVNVIQRGAASVYVYLHGKDCSAETEGDVMTRRSED